MKTFFASYKFYFIIIINLARFLAALFVICPIARVRGQWLSSYQVNIVFLMVLGFISHLPVSLHSRAYVKI